MLDFDPYGGTIPLGTFSIFLNRKISLVQDKVVSLLGYRDVPREQVYRSLSLLSFHRIVKYFTCIKFYKSVSYEQPYFFEKIVSHQVPHFHGTRFKYDERLTLPTYIKTKFQRSFLCQGIQFWNLLPVNLRLIGSPLVFKKRLKIFLLDSL